MHQKITAMYDTTHISTTDVLILCGGLGTRLRSLGGGDPKVLLRFGEKVFIDILIESIVPFGFRRFVMCTGFQKGRVKEHFKHKKLDILFSEEDEALGTGGAVKKAMAYIKSSPFLVLNGDSLCRIDYTKFLEFHGSKGGLLSIVLARPIADSGYGIINIDENYKVTNFQEKAKAHKGDYINAGIYLLNHEIFRFMPNATKFSLEYDLFPNVLMQGCYGFVAEEEVIDIGTPERYYRAKIVFS